MKVIHGRTSESHDFSERDTTPNYETGIYIKAADERPLAVDRGAIEIQATDWPRITYTTSYTSSGAKMSLFNVPLSVPCDLLFKWKTDVSRECKNIADFRDIL